MEWINEKEQLHNLLVENNLSYEEVGRRYGYSGNYIKKVAIKLGIQLNPRRKINPSETFNKGKTSSKICKNCGREYLSFPHTNSIFCSTECSNKYKSKLKYLEYLQHPEKYEGPCNMLWIKKHILQEQDNKCLICGCENTWNNKPLVFILDHIDGHAYNNIRSNLRLICPNCDSQLATYKSKNRHSDRIYYHSHHR